MISQLYLREMNQLRECNGQCDFYLWTGEKSKPVHSDSSLLYLCHLVRQKLNFKFVYGRKICINLAQATFPNANPSPSVGQQVHSNLQLETLEWQGQYIHRSNNLLVSDSRKNPECIICSIFFLNKPVRLVQHFSEQTSLEAKLV